METDSGGLSLVALAGWEPWLSALGLRPLFLPMYMVPLLLTLICFPKRASMVEAITLMAEVTGAEDDFRARVLF